MKTPSFAILLAAYNGTHWLEEQLESILLQNPTNSNVNIFVSVDLSTDNTYDWFRCLAESDERIQLLDYGHEFGGASRNFFRLIKEVSLTDYDYISFSDQDDIFRSDKLMNATRKLDEGYDAYSSNVTAFWPDGREKLIDKAQPQREWDFAFEAAGPGCTYVLTSDFAQQFKDFLIVHWDEANNIKLHDWLIYAYARSNGHSWFIDEKPGLLYRQHENNFLGANTGLTSALGRVYQVRAGWYRQECQKIARLVGYDQDPFVHRALFCGWLGKLYLSINTHKARRRLRDRIALSLLCVFNIF